MKDSIIKSESITYLMIDDDLITTYKYLTKLKHINISNFKYFHKLHHLKELEDITITSTSLTDLEKIYESNKLKNIFSYIRLNISEDVKLFYESRGITIN